MSPPQGGPSSDLCVARGVWGDWCPQSYAGGVVWSPANPGRKQGHGTHLGLQGCKYRWRQTRGGLRGHFLASDDARLHRKR